MAILISFEDIECRSLGRNGIARTVGAEVSVAKLDSIEIVRVSPVTIKPDAEPCFIEIPLVNLVELVDRLRSGERNRG